MSFIYRETLGRPLSWAELDSNFAQVDTLVASASAELGNASAKATQAAVSASAAQFSASQAQISANDAANSVAPLLPLIQSGAASGGAGALPFDGSLAYPSGSAGNALAQVEPLTYQNGVPLTVWHPTQVILRGNARYYAKLPASFPLSLSGVWADDQSLLSAIPSDGNLASAVTYTYPDGTVGVVQDLSDAVKGVGLIGFKAAGSSAVARSLAERYRTEEKYRSYVIDYMTPAMVADVIAGTRSVDTYPAYAAARNALPLDGGVIIAPGGTSRLDTELALRHGVSIEGTGYMYSTDGIAPGNTVLVPNHSGRSCLSLIGANGCIVRNLCIKAYPGLYPQTATVLGRSSAASAGQHHFENVAILGHYSKSPFYLVASEDNIFTNLYIWLFGGGAKYCHYSGISDSLSVGGLQASSNLHNTFIHPFFINSSTDANAAAMYFECAQATGNVQVVGGYLIPFSGAYIHLDMGAIDGLSPIGTFSFHVNGERLSGGDPTWGIRVTASGTQTLKLAVSGGRFDLLASGSSTHWDINIPGNVILEAPDITMPPPEAFPYASSVVSRAGIHGGNVTIGRFSRWLAPTFNSGWGNTFGAPAAPAGFRISSDNTVCWQGTIGGPAAGDAFTLPADYRPFVDLYFPVSSGATPTMGRIKIASATGVVSFTGTQFTQIDLSSIRYNLSLP